MQFIADTGFIAGFWDRNETIRQWARTTAAKHPGPHLTCEAVLVEASYLVGPTRIARAAAEGDYVVDFQWQEHAGEILELVKRYADQEMDATDACIVLLAEQNPSLAVLTIDRKDFSVYRTRAGKPIRCSFPPI